jgi:hypothetical protein
LKDITDSQFAFTVAAHDQFVKLCEQHNISDSLAISTLVALICEISHCAAKDKLDFMKLCEEVKRAMIGAMEISTESFDERRACLVATSKGDTHDAQ